MVLKDSSKIMLGSQEVQRIYLGSVKVYENFPAGYRPVEWLQASGTQYINAGNVNVGNNYEYECKCQFANENENQLFGRKHWYNNAVFISNNKLMCTPNGESGYADTGISPTEIVTVFAKSTDNTITVNDFVNRKSSFSPLSTNYALVLFAYCNSYDTSISDYGKGRIYYFKFWLNNQLIRDMRPCVRIADGVAGMYDLVNNVFYTNAGTGNFVVPT